MGTQLLYLAVGLVGVAVLRIPALVYRVGRVDCPEWPLPGAATAEQLWTLAGIALLTVAWAGMLRARETRLWRVMLGGAVLHAAALTVPCFLSQDPLYYAAIGRAMARFHASPYASIASALPPDDPFFLALPAFWRAGTSAYFPGFHALAWLVAKLAGDDLRLTLTLYQAIGALAMLATGWLAARAAGTARAAAIVIFSPLAIVDGTVSGHNDALLAVAVAAFALAVTRRRPAGGALALAAGAATKLSGLLLGGFAALAAAFRWARDKRGVAPAIAGLTVVALALSVPLFDRVTPLVAPPSASSTDFCTTFTVECALRYGVRHGIGWPTGAWALGVAFRIAGVGFVLWAAWRAANDQRLLPWAALVVFAWYLAFQGRTQTWYWLPLLPLIPFADRRWSRPMLILCASAVATYPLHLRFACADEQHLPTWTRALGAAVELAAVNLPLLWAWGRRSTAPADAP